MGTIFSNMLETVAPIKLKKVREKRAAPWYKSYTHSLKKETRILECKWRKTNLEVFKILSSSSSFNMLLTAEEITAAVNSSLGIVTILVGATLALPMTKEQWTLSSLNTQIYEH